MIYPALHITDSFVRGKATLNPREIEITKSVLTCDQCTIMSRGPGFAVVSFHLYRDEWDALLDLCPSLSHKRTMALPGFIMTEKTP